MSIVGGAGGIECCQAMEACVVTTSVPYERERPGGKVWFLCQGRKERARRLARKKETEKESERARCVLVNH
jgi:hypothetical protein